MSEHREVEPAKIGERVANNTARIEWLELELGRARDRLHSLEGSVAGVAYIGRQVAELARNVERLAGEIHTIGRRAVERPTPAGLSATAALASVAVAIAALLVSALR